ncbi:phosphate ABC transporter substrate-binding protein [Helicobacter muridarum]|uniref:Phosphate ABC transporter n=1 Tax=Helicobacter muridarum TaxID=216 RepID=A0A099TZ02_9HELI|nr:substrate-binding domain-containing protein [Helicobacter muridarum]TLE00007.1 phosphate ABC transporter substrate-binding protein [Helicobacter muridarum]STQ87080.1 phosphate ABC transporter [Helicobacter muridarum]
MKKFLSILLLAFGVTSMFANNIHPVSRESGSGTRGAFVDIFDVKKVVNDKNIDAITKKAEVTNSTGVMLSTIANIKDSIGYISLGSLNNQVKALKIDGVAPSSKNIKNKSYPIYRSFNLVYKQESPLLIDFLNYTKSKQAQEVIQKAGYIAISKDSFTSKKHSGKLVISGSSSITPLMEKLIESYKEINPSASIELQQSDSTTGVNSVVQGIADIGMVSRDIKKSEKDKGLSVKTLANDGLAIIVNTQNKIENLSKEQVKKIFLGQIVSWKDLK